MGRSQTHYLQPGRCFRSPLEDMLMLTRRHFVVATALTPAVFGKMSFAQATKTLQVYTSGDTNISNWWNDSIKPAFEAAHPGYSFNVTITRGVGDENGAIAARALAALQSNTDPQVDYFEEFEPASVAGSVEAGLWLEMTPANVPNLAMINPAAPEAPIR